MYREKTVEINTNGHFTHSLYDSKNTINTSKNKNNNNINNNNYKTCYNFNDCGLIDEYLPVPSLSLGWCRTIVFILSFACFSITAFGGLYFDDTVAVVSNKDVRTNAPFTDIFTNDFWGTKLRSSISHKSYRPITVLTFRLNYLVSGLQPFGYHMVNVLLYAICCVMLLHVCSIIIGGFHVDKNGIRVFTAPKASLLCCCFFAVHPIHTENVAAVVGRADILCMIFYSVSFVKYATFVNKYDSRGTNSIGDLIVAISSAILATFSKEQGITV